MDNTSNEDIDFEHISSVYDNTASDVPIVEEKISDKTKSLIMKNFPFGSLNTFEEHFCNVFDRKYERDLNVTIGIKREYPKDGVHSFTVTIVEDEVLDDGTLMPRTEESQKFKSLARRISVPPSWYLRKFIYEKWEYEIREINLRARTYPIICRGIKIEGRGIGRVKSVKFNKTHLQNLILN